MWEQDDSVPDETDDEEHLVPARPTASAAVVEQSDAALAPGNSHRWVRLEVKAPPAESIYDVVNELLTGSRPKVACTRELPRAAIAHKRALREETEDDADVRRWDERAPRAKHEHVPQLACKFFLSPRGCHVVNCPFAHAQTAEARATQLTARSAVSAAVQCKFWKSGSCMHGAKCSFLHR
jgi:hypothetical protein